MKPKVYVSIGSAASPYQKKGADAIFRSLETAGLSPRQMEKNEWSAEQPLRAIKRIIEECHGVVVIAFPRYLFSSGVERQKDGTEKQLNDARLTTVWNQIEAALGYSNDLPLLVIAEQGLHEDGLLEGRYDWKVYWTDFSQLSLQSESFVAFLESWKRLVVERSTIAASLVPDGLDLSKLSLRQFFSYLTVPQIWAAVSALIASFAAVGTAAFKAGSGHWPWN